MTNTTKTNNLTVRAVLAAVVFIISFLPLKTMGLELTLSMLPVAVGAIVYGPVTGAILGGVFGAASFIQCLGYSAFGATLFGINPWLTLLVCLPTRILAGYLTGLLYRLLHRFCKRGWWDATVASFAAAVLNTLLFMSVLTLCFYNTAYLQGIATSFKATNPVIFIILFAGINSLVEIILGFVIAPPVAKALLKYTGTH